MYTILNLALTNAVLAGILGALVFTVTKWWRNQFAVRALWLIVLVKLVTPPIIAVPLVLPQFSPQGTAGGAQPTQQSGSSARSGVEVQTDSALGLAPNDPARDLHASANSPAGRGAVGDRDTMSAGGRRVTIAEVTAVLGIIWLAGSLFWLCAATLRIVRFVRMVPHDVSVAEDLHRQLENLSRGMGIRRCPRLLLTSSSIAPLVWSVLRRPTILMPTGLLSRLSAEQTATILAHELAHVKRGNCWLRWFEMLVIALYWWHPVVWWAVGHLHQADEECCDATVLKFFPGKSRLYAEALLKTAEFLQGGTATPRMACALGRAEHLKRRMAMIIDDRLPARIPPSCRVLLLLFALLVLPLTARAIENDRTLPERNPGKGDPVASSAVELARDTEEGQTVKPVADRKISNVVQRTMERLARRSADPLSVAEHRSLFAIEVETGAVTLIASEPRPGFANCGSPSWSSDGQQILFDVTPKRSWRESRLLVIDASERDAQLKDLGAGNCPTLSRGGEQAAFFLNPGSVPDAPAGIWVMDADGSQRRCLGGGGWPLWSPKSDQLLVVSFRSPLSMRLMDVKSGEEREVHLPGHTVYSKPSWAGDDQTIVAVVVSESGGGIALIDVGDPERAQVKRILWRKGDRLDLNPFFPVYSSQTDCCVFVGGDRNGMALYSLQGGAFDAPRRLEPDVYDNFIADLAFSPDGRFVLFCSDRLYRPQRQGQTAHDDE